jgi:hypothetical protein
MTHKEIVNLISNFNPPPKFAEEYSSLANHAQMLYYNTCKENDDPDLRPFKKFLGLDSDSPALKITDNAQVGVAPLPADYDKYYSLTYLYNGKQVPIEVLDEKTFDYRKNHPTEVPTKRYPVCNIHGNEISFLPLQLQFANFSYLRHPKTVNMAVKGTHGYAEYDSANSVEFEWDESAYPFIIQNILTLIGIPSTINEINNLKNQKQ